MEQTKTAEGLLLVDKPAGKTSHDAVLTARRVYAQKSIGHLGTLDPFATGLLLLLLGRFTRLANFLATDPKIYDAVIRFGAETDTDDSTGTMVSAAPLPHTDSIVHATQELTGAIQQVPPAYSAKSVDGVRAYEAARAGNPLALSPVHVEVHEWRIHSVSPSELHATIVCSSGTYIRALARDAGRLAGSAAHLAVLRRTRSGEFSVADATPLDELERVRPEPLRLRVVAARE